MNCDFTENNILYEEQNYIHKILAYIFHIHQLEPHITAITTTAHKSQ